jgi:hypothetical protein|tara:strand:+ start:191 stop:454 length:264 start_codon:yes stop_codon:yes gene_type:complete
MALKALLKEVLSAYLVSHRMLSTAQAHLVPLLRPSLLLQAKRAQLHRDAGACSPRHAYGVHTRPVAQVNSNELRLEHEVLAGHLKVS